MKEQILPENKITLPTIICDTREQTPLNFSSLHIRGIRSLCVKTQKLDEGDYSVEGLEHVLFIERKSVNDLYGTIFKGRERFERELIRAQKQEKRYLIIEASPYLFLKYLQNHDKMHMYNSAIATLESFAQKYDLRVRWLKTRENAADYIAKLAIKTMVDNQEDKMKFTWQEFYKRSILSGCKDSDFTPEICFNAGVLIAKINQLGYVPAKVFSSCLRSKERQIAIYKDKGITDIKKIPLGSAHLNGCAVDIEDSDEALDKWLIENESKLIKLGLYVEDSESTKGWAHIQSVAPKSGKRFFKP